MLGVVAGVKRPDGEKAPVTRRERARRTRERMIRAAQELLVEQGYAGTTMVDIAARANVAVQTLYFAFHTKPELLNACFEAAVLGDDPPTAPPEQGWHRSMLDASTGPVALRHFAEGNSDIVRRIVGLDEVLRSAVHEPEVLEVQERHEHLRRQGYRRLVEHLDQRFGLLPALDRDKAADLLLDFGGPSHYRNLVNDCGWRHEHYVDWLAGTLVQLLLGYPTDDLSPNRP
jgi:AcrR family transcriptional regulator